MLERLMQLHGANRVYTRDSLEFWFSKLEKEWDGAFPPEHLAAGRQLYRGGGIRGIELTGRDAIIHCRIDKKDEYSVLEWDEETLGVRSSSADKALANTIAVAGLHEIEELVADEIPVLPEEAPADAATPAPPAGEATSPTDATVALSVETPHSKAPGQAAAPPKARAKKTDRPKRELVLKLRVEPTGLVCEPWWHENNGHRTRALNPTGKTNGNGTSTPHAKGLEMPAGDGNGNPAPGAAERMKLISLTALARKSHFRFRGEAGAYVLEQTSEIPHFLKNVLPTWKRSFAIEFNADVERLSSGVKSVRVEARAGLRSSDNELSLEWIFRTGEQLLTADVSKLLTESGGAPVIIPEVGMVSLAPQGLESLRQWKESTGELEDGTLPAYLLFSLFNDQRCSLELSPELEAWRESLATPVPGTLKLPEFLRPYQRRGVEWMAHMAEHGCHSLLADEMGLGKTVQVAALLSARPVKGKNNLVVCPASVVPVWQEEIQRFFPQLQIFVLRSGHDFRNEKGHGIWLASYAQLRNHRELLASHDFGYAVLDEGQFIKNPDAKVTNTCFEIRAQHRLVLTGTPLENRQLDLWSILRFLLPGLLGTRAAFETALMVNRESTMEKLRQQLAPFILRRTKAQVATELPPKVEMELLCPLTDTQRFEYARVCREGLERLGDDIGQAMREKAFGFLSLLTRLRQICCDPDLLPWLHADLETSGKLALLVERLGEIISGGHKVVIFSQFVMFLKRVREALDVHFPTVPRFELTGATVDRQKPVQDFQNIEEASFMLVSLKAAGTGITLHAADYVFLLDPWWNPSVEDQAVDRVHRIGQTRTVFVYRMITQGTIEDRIQALQEEKKQLFQQLIDGVSGDMNLSQHFHSLRELIELPADSGDGSD